MSINISGSGIVEANLADDAVTLAKMAGGTDGNLITYDASGDPAYVTTGTSGQVLTSGGTGVAPTFQTAAGGATGMDDVSGVARATSGLLFNADTADANKLDDYEEGTFTPILSGTTSSGALNGWYRKVGSLVTVAATLTNKTLSSSSGTAKITNLPFSVISTSAGLLGYNNTTASSSSSGSFIGSTTEFNLYNSGTIANATFSNGGGKYLLFTGNYITA